MMQTYQDVMTMANALALKGCVTDEVNQNLTYAQKMLLRAHYQLGHLGFKAVQWIGRQGWLGPLGEKMGQSNV